jgi:hypothetical protein
MRFFDDIRAVLRDNISAVSFLFLQALTSSMHMLFLFTLQDYMTVALDNRW